MRPYLLKWLTETKKSLKRHQRGMILPLVLSYSMVFTTTVAGLALYSTSISRQIESQKNHMKTFYIAETALEKTLAQIRLFVDTNGRAPTTNELGAMQANVPVVGGFSYADVSGNNSLNIVYQPGGWKNKQLTLGSFTGLNASVQTVTMSIVARNPAGNYKTPVSLSQAIEIQAIPIFQFGAFYENDFEIARTANMTVSGPIHSNKNIYLNAGTGASLTFQGKMTSVGKILAAVNLNSTAAGTGPIYINDGKGVAQPMQNTDNTWLDSNHPDWKIDSQTRWDERVKSADHNVETLKLPIPSTMDPHIIIERRSNNDSSTVKSQKMDYKANLRLIDGSVADQYGNTVDLRYCSDNTALINNACKPGTQIVNPLSSGSFYNHREGKTIQTTDVDINLLNKSPAFQAIVAASPTGVVIYHSDLRNTGSSVTQQAIRLVNGSALPAKGLTVASQNPLYIKGDYNTSNKKAAGLITDAVNVLSGQWTDGASAMPVYNRVAGNTSINVAVITGDTATVANQHNGGYNNIFRLMENWSGKTLSHQGSVSVMYRSAIATGPWAVGNPWYLAPNRNWAYDSAFSGAAYSIPGFPSLYTVTKTGWSITTSSNSYQPDSSSTSYTSL